MALRLIPQPVQTNRVGVTGPRGFGALRAGNFGYFGSSFPGSAPGGTWAASGGDPTLTLNNEPLSLPSITLDAPTFDPGSVGMPAIDFMTGTGASAPGAQQGPAPTSFNWKPWAIGGGLLLVGLYLMGGRGR